MTKPTDPPAHLEPTEAELWIALRTSGQLTTPAELALLTATVEAHGRARRCRAEIDRDGETAINRFGKPQRHHLLSTEGAARATFVRGLTALRLD